MEGLAKKAGYLKGLIEGMDFSNDPAQEKLFGTMVELLNDISDRVESMEELMDDLNDYVESIDDDLSALEGERDDDGFNMINDDEFEDEYLDEMEDGEDHLHLLNGNAGRRPADEDDPETLAGSVCPECGRMFFIGANDPEDARYTCPHCKKLVSPVPLTPENAPIARPEKPEA